ncbi:DNA double-strand break repair nuclease NurA [bacterium]|nr:MAG: DNA double-strand break repair nuclease NurA [bacterium]
MSLDFQDVRKQVIDMGESAALRTARIKELREQARAIFDQYSDEVDALRGKVEQVARLHDPLIRTAMPFREPLNSSFPLPPLPHNVTFMAADGSQIAPDRHAQVDYCLTNVAVISMQAGTSLPPSTLRRCNLLTGDMLHTEHGLITDARLNLMRDFAERSELAKAALEAFPPVVSFTDGALELWMSPSNDHADQSEFKKQQKEYLRLLKSLCQRSVITAGYVDKPGSSLLVRLLEIAMTPENLLPDIRRLRPLRGILDVDILFGSLEPGQRSAVFALKSRSTEIYQEELALHFFFLNVGRPEHPYWARVEIPAWVAEDESLLDVLHAALVQQCSVLGSRPYPYLLHRAHEDAVVTLREKEEVSQMIALELRKRGVEVGEASNKQFTKDSGSRMRYSR